MLIIGSGFAGLNAAKGLAGVKGINVTIIDRSNYHLFQPLLYQVATAGLSPAEIAVPIRSILAGYKNIKIFQGEVHSINPKNNSVSSDIGIFHFDYLILACGARHYYFGNEKWEKFSPGLKTIEQATEIRRRILTAFEKAEAETEPKEKAKLLTFVIVGGGSTGVELAGALGELSRYTLVKDFKNIDPKLAQIILVEAGSRILPYFSESSSKKATRDLEKLCVQVLTSKHVTKVDENGIEMGAKKIHAATILWAAGIRSSNLNNYLDGELDTMGRIFVEPDLSLKSHPNIFVAGDQANFTHKSNEPLPAIAPVALQQGRCIAKNIIKEMGGQAREEFTYFDKGQLATIGRSKAVLEIGQLKLGGFPAWISWLFVHIFYLIGFKNRLFVFLQWMWSYLTYGKGARLIVEKKWRFYYNNNADND